MKCLAQQDKEAMSSDFEGIKRYYNVEKSVKEINFKKI